MNVPDPIRYRLSDVTEAMGQAFNSEAVKQQKTADRALLVFLDLTIELLKKQPLQDL